MRLAKNPTELIQRDKPIHFYWNGKKLPAYAGDMLSSALLANGVSHVGSSFKYGRKRGIFSAWSDEPNALVTLEDGGLITPNARATEVEVYDGMRVRAAWGKKIFGIDLKELFMPMHRAMPAGFYYKTFQKPQFLSSFYENIIRGFAGFSTSSTEGDSEFYEEVHEHCDVLIVGGGVAGLAAARTLSDKGLDIILADDRPWLGGQWYLNDAKDIDAKTTQNWIEDSVKVIKGKVKILQRTTCYGLYEENLMLAAERLQDHLTPDARQANLPRQRHHKIRAKEIIVAAGAYERGMSFVNNDLPGIMLANAVHANLKLFSIMPNRIVVFVNNDSGYSLARDLQQEGCKDITLVDARSNQNLGQDLSEDKSQQPSLPEGVELLSGYVPLKAKSKQGRLHSIIMQNADGKNHELTCDVLALSCGYDPVVHLTCHKNNRPQWSPELACLLPTTKGSLHVAGAMTGHFRTTTAIQSGEQAAIAALQSMGLAKDEKISPIKHDNFNVLPLFVNEKGKGKKFVDLQNDVTSTDIELALRENYRSIEHVKRYTAVGFGTDQGKTSNVIALNHVAKTLGLKLDEIGTTTYRPPYTPVTFGTLAGPHASDFYEPYRYTPMNASHAKEDPEWEVVGQWMRPRHFPRGSENMQDALDRECMAARNSVAVMDASTLGKIDVRGPDAREFLNRVYTNSWTKLAPGKCRYGIMLNENGMVFDDGVTACISDEEFYLTTTTGGAAGVYTWLENWLQTEWPELKVYLSSVTDNWATTAVVGPKSREVLQSICKDIDFSQEKFEFMDWYEGTVCGVPARVMRISFSGELAYEINVQANYGKYIWDSVCAAGEKFNIARYGTETMHVLRAEKGFIIVGQDTDGFVTPMDLQMGWILPKKKPYSYLGKRSLTRTEMLSESRPQLVGLLPKDEKVVLPEGCQLVDSLKTSSDMQGHVTSSYYSANLGRSFAMALVKGGIKRYGETIYGITRGGDPIAAEITEPFFYDKQNEKKDG